MVRIQRHLLLSLSLLLLALTSGCSSGTPQADLIDPQITIRDIAGRVPPNQMLSAPIDLHVLFEIRNRSQQNFVLKRLTMQSIGASGVRVGNETRPFNQAIAAGESASVEVWLRGYATGQSMLPTIPFTLRGTAVFDTPVGEKRTTFIEQMSLSLSLR